MKQDAYVFMPVRMPNRALAALDIYSIVVKSFGQQQFTIAISVGTAKFIRV